MSTGLLAQAKEAIIRVGEGRGFLVSQGPWPHAVITAAHCLPNLPPAHPASYVYERTYQNLLGPIGGALTLWAECVFVDPIADLAVLMTPDGQASEDSYNASVDYEEFMEHRPTLRIGPIVTGACPVSLLTIDGVWQRCTAEPGRPALGYKLPRALTLVGATTGNAPGCSGSPILTDDSFVIGLVSVGSISTNTAGERTINSKQHGQPMLATNLPPWLLADPRAFEPLRGGA